MKYEYVIEQVFDAIKHSNRLSALGLSDQLSMDNIKDVGDDVVAITINFESENRVEQGDSYAISPLIGYSEDGEPLFVVNLFVEHGCLVAMDIARTSRLPVAET